MVIKACPNNIKDLDTPGSATAMQHENTATGRVQRLRTPGVHQLFVDKQPDELARGSKSYSRRGAAKRVTLRKPEGPQTLKQKDLMIK